MFYNNSRIEQINEIIALCKDVNNTNNMFCGCYTLTELDLSDFDTSKVTIMASMFNGCSNLKNLDVSNFNTNNVTTMEKIFYSCKLLTDLNLSNFDLSSINVTKEMFKNCTNLTNLTSFKNLGKGFTLTSNNYSSYKLDLSSCTNLTYESLMDVINNLYDLNLTYDVANGGTLYTQSLVLGSTNLAKLTSEEIAIATSKGWVVS